MATQAGAHDAATELPCDIAPDPSVRAELRRYLDSAFVWPSAPVALPLPDEPSVAAWRGYAEAAARDHGGRVWPVLQAALPQLRFPIDAAVRHSEAYRAAVRRGDLSGVPEAGLRLQAPDHLTLTLHPTPAGHVPILAPAGRADFETLMQAITKRSAPEPIPASMGACIIAGFNNWDRIAALRAAWEAGQEAESGDWQAYFRDQVVPNKPLYQDTFIILSDGPYSGVDAATLGLTDPAWRAASHVIRREHEVTHFITRRLCGSMRNNIHDELIADYFGLVAAFGRFDAETFQRFLGLRPDGAVDPGGRLGIYRGDPPLSEPAYAALHALIRRAAGRLEALHDATLAARHGSLRGRGVLTLALTRLGLADLAAPDAEARLAAALSAAEAVCHTATPVSD